MLRFLAFIVIIVASIIISYIINSKSNGEIAIGKEEETEEDKKKKKKEEEGKSKIVLFLEKGKFAFLLDLWNNEGSRSLIFAFIAWVVFNLAMLSISPIIFDKIIHSNWYTATNIILWPVLILLGQWKKTTFIVYIVVIIGIATSVILFGYEIIHPESTWVIETEKKIQIANKIVILTEIEKKNMLKRLARDEDTIKGMEERAEDGKLSLEEKQKIKRKKEKLKKELEELRGEDKDNGAIAKTQKPEPIVEIINIPAGISKNEVGNLVFTGLFPNKGDHVQFTVLKGGPAQYRNGITNERKDRIQFNDQITIKIEQDGGEIQFIKWNNPSEVEVKITLAN